MSQTSTTSAFSVVRQVGSASADHLTAVLAGQAFDAEFRVTDAAARTGITQASASKLVQRLLGADAIEQARTEGKRVYYRLRSGDATVALGLRATS